MVSTSIHTQAQETMGVIFLIFINSGICRLIVIAVGKRLFPNGGKFRRGSHFQGWEAVWNLEHHFLEI